MKGSERLVSVDLLTKHQGLKSVLLTGFILFGSMAGVLAQGSSGYILIQTEPSQPFYVRTADSLYHSAEGNYLVLAPLRGIKDVSIGMHGAQAPLAVFTVEDSSMEAGLVLRNMGEEGWRLLNWQTNEMIKIRRPGREESEMGQMQRRSDAFAIRLAQAVNDEAILYYRRAMVLKPTVKNIPIYEPDQRKEKKIEVEQQKTTETFRQEKGNVAGNKITPVRRLEMIRTSAGLKITYEVQEPGGKDIVIIEIPKES